MATPQKKTGRKNKLSNVPRAYRRPQWCNSCDKPWTTAREDCPGCRRPFVKRIRAAPVKNEWHAATPAREIRGGILEVCQQVKTDTVRQRCDAMASIWFDTEIIATVRRWPDGRAEINYNEEHKLWDALQPILMQALTESGLATA